MSDIKYQNLIKAVISLKVVLAEDKTDIVRDSSIKRYEICYELAWKAVQEYLKNEGLEICDSPKNCFKQAFKLGLITDEEKFIEMVQNRNLTAHIYNQELAEQIYTKLGQYSGLLDSLAKNIGNHNDI